jgi:hypothetical protein
MEGKGLHVELTKYAPIALHYRYLDLLNMCWTEGYISEEWGVTTVVPIYKKETDKNVKMLELLVFYVLHVNAMPKSSKEE